jgi:D-arabinitol 4-dehydrogenase
MKTTDSTLITPFDFNPNDCVAGIIHVGVGAFHRAHQAVYINRLLGHKDQQQWGIIGVNLRSEDAHVVAQLANQEHRYTLKTLSPENEVTYQDIGSILATQDWSRDPNSAAQAANNRNIHLITMTVTESGYYLLENGQLDIESPVIIQALESTGSCIYAYLRAALNARRLGCNLPITLLSCDNLRDNGRQLKSGFEQFLDACNDQELRAWVVTNVTFPCCMVDRITPRPNLSHVIDIREKFSFDDPLTVMAESYIQWVIEDNFAAPKPDFERVGADLVADVSPYEDVKIRILNGGHTILTYLAVLKGYLTYDEGLADGELNTLFSAYETTEVIPAIGSSPIDLMAYYQSTKTRFGNSNIADSLARICADGGSKFPIFILPTLTGCYAQGHTPENALQGISGWYVFMCKVRAGKIEFDYIEPKWKSLEPLLDENNLDIFATDKNLWGSLPQQFPQFRTQLVNAITIMLLRFPTI